MPDEVFRSTRKACAADSGRHLAGQSDIALPHMTYLRARN
jgi:hypothetical protein